jgi:hypothetical protein
MSSLKAHYGMIISAEMEARIILEGQYRYLGKMLQGDEGLMRRSAPHRQAPLYQELYEQIVRVLYHCCPVKIPDSNGVQI